jgi:hypothetical protein
MKLKNKINLKDDSHYVHNRAPTGERISVHRVQQRLRDRLEQILRLQIRLPQALGDTKQLLARRAGDDKVLCKVDAPDQVCRGDERLVPARRRLVQASDDGLDKVRAEAAFVERRGDEVGERLWLDFTLFFDGVHVHPVAEHFAAVVRAGGEWERRATKDVKGIADSVVTSVANPGRPMYVRSVTGKI